MGGSTWRCACIRPSCSRRRCTGCCCARSGSWCWRRRRWAHRDPHELLRDEALIRYDRRLGGGQAAERYLRRAGIVPRERFEISSLAAIAMLVGRGVGVSIAPDAATAWWPTLPVARLPLPQSSEARRFGMVWPRTSPRTRAIEVLVDHARRVMAMRQVALVQRWPADRRRAGVQAERHVLSGVAQRPSAAAEQGFAGAR